MGKYLCAENSCICISILLEMVWNEQTVWKCGQKYLCEAAKYHQLSFYALVGGEMSQADDQNRGKHFCSENQRENLEIRKAVVVKGKSGILEIRKSFVTKGKWIREKQNCCESTVLDSKLEWRKVGLKPGQRCSIGKI